MTALTGPAETDTAQTDTANTDTATILRASDRPATPWRNGGGQTFQIDSYPPDSGLDDFGWRVSIAEIDADGSFSKFDGVDRTIAVIDGVGLELDIADQVHHLGKYTTYRFPGEAEVTGHLLRGATRDLNLMVRRGEFAGRLEIFSSATSRTLPIRVGADETVLLVVLDGDLLVDQGDSETTAAHRLTSEDALRQSGPRTLRADLTGTVAVVHVTRLPQIANSVTVR